MAKWFATSILDDGLQEIRDLALAGSVQMHLVDAAPAAPPVYATVLADSLNDPGVNMEQADMPLNSSGNNRRLEYAAKTGSATRTFGAGAGNLHVATLDITGTLVLSYTDETSEQAITSGNDINFPAHNYTFQQPA